MAQLVQGDQNSTMARALEYQRLVASGMPPQQAFQQAFPQGIPQPPTPQEQAKEQQSQAIGQIGGTLAAALGTYYGASAIKDMLAKKGAEEATKQVATSTAANAAGSTAGTTGSALAGGTSTLAGGSGGSAFGGGISSSSLGAPMIDATSGQVVGTSMSGAPSLTASAAGNLSPTVAPTPGAFSLSGIGSAGNAVLPAVGAIGAYDLFKNQRTGKRGYLQGAASGAALGSFFGPLGTGIGAALGLAAGGANEMMDTNKFKTEGNRLAKLQKRGINIPDALRAPMELRAGRSREQLAAIEQDKINRGGYGNVDFAMSRDESKLKPEDIWGYSAFMDKFGNDWLGTFNEQQRRDIAQEALNAGAVKESKGSIDIDWNKIPTNKPAVSAAKPVADAAKSPTNKPQTKLGSRLLDAVKKTNRR